MSEQTNETSERDERRLHVLQDLSSENRALKQRVAELEGRNSSPAPSSAAGTARPCSTASCEAAGDTAA